MQQQLTNKNQQQQTMLVVVITHNKSLYATCYDSIDVLYTFITRKVPLVEQELPTRPKHEFTPGFE
jgi:ABC-type dipeptide/oligopeptide/nickel transport system ATPase component